MSSGQIAFRSRKRKLKAARDEWRSHMGRRLLIQAGLGTLRGAIVGGYAGFVGSGLLFGVGAVPGAIIVMPNIDIATSFLVIERWDPRTATLYVWSECYLENGGGAVGGFVTPQTPHRGGGGGGIGGRPQRPSPTPTPTPSASPTSTATPQKTAEQKERIRRVPS